jgi:hypothetical protein
MMTLRRLDIAGLLLVLLALAWRIGQADAEPKTPPKYEPTGQVRILEETSGSMTVMDAGGRVHKVMRRMITPEQREAAAERAKAARAAAPRTVR